MLFNLQIGNIDGALQNYTDRISDLEQQLVTLREEQSQLQEHKQKLLTAEQAAESALEQVKLAVNLVGSVDNTQVEVLQNAIDKVFSDFSLAPKLEPVEVITDESEEIVSQEEGALEIHASKDTEELETAIADSEDVDAAPETLSKEQLALFTIKQLTKVATEYFNLPTEQIKECKRKNDWVNLLLSQEVTNADIKLALPEDF